MPTKNMKNEESFMKLALEQAQLAKASGDLPFGAIVVQGNKVVGKGHAENNTVGDVTDHAELLAVREACKMLGKNNLSDCVMYHVRRRYFSSQYPESRDRRFS